MKRLTSAGQVIDVATGEDVDRKRRAREVRRLNKCIAEESAAIQRHAVRLANFSAALDEVIQTGRSEAATIYIEYQAEWMRVRDEAVYAGNAGSDMKVMRSLVSRHGPDTVRSRLEQFWHHEWARKQAFRLSVFDRLFPDLNGRRALTQTQDRALATRESLRRQGLWSDGDAQ